MAVLAAGAEESATGAADIAGPLSGFDEVPCDGAFRTRATACCGAAGAGGGKMTSATGPGVRWRPRTAAAASDSDLTLAGCRSKYPAQPPSTSTAPRTKGFFPISSAFPSANLPTANLYAFAEHAHRLAFSGTSLGSANECFTKVAE